MAGSTASNAGTASAPARTRSSAIGLEPDRRARLLAAKLGALVRDADVPSATAPSGDWSPVEFAAGAALVDDDRAWVLIDDRAERGLGPALAWAHRRGVVELDLVFDAGAAVAARRAALFASPPRVWEARGRTLAVAAPAPYQARTPAPLDAVALLEALDGLDVVVEHGVVTGEVRGLEMVRAVPDESTGAWRVEVGVGRHDREAFTIIHGEVPLPDAVAAVVDVVRTHRRPGAPGHPLNRLAPERWLRHALVTDPSRLAGWTLEVVEGPEPRRGINDAQPAVAAGRDSEGRPVVVVCSVGMDLGLVPLAADARARLDPAAHLVLAVPARDVHPVTVSLADALADPAAVLPIEGDWRT